MKTMKSLGSIPNSKKIFTSQVGLVGLALVTFFIFTSEAWNALIPLSILFLFVYLFTGDDFNYVFKLVMSYIWQVSVGMFAVVLVFFVYNPPLDFYFILFSLILLITVASFLISKLGARTIAMCLLFILLLHMQWGVLQFFFAA